MSAGHALKGLEPAALWERFAELTRIPRPSKQEAEAREHVLAWAHARRLATDVDSEGNTVVRVPASPGRESAPTVVLQAHLDMVCERDPGSPYDPREGRINVVVDGDWVVAEGTTLGADNGIGVAAALAVVGDPAIEHGPLELLLTVSEERGLDGAKELDPALVSGRLLINLDGTSDDALTVGCAGSAHTFVRFRLDTKPVGDGAVAVEVTVSGARGGHSGGDIARGRANAIKALGRVLSLVFEQAPFGLARLEGGASRNAIPREARARAVMAPSAEDAFRWAAETELAALRKQFAATEPELALTIERTPVEAAASTEETSRALDLVAALPAGVLAMIPDVPGAVETSTSLTVATTEDDVVTLASMTRSSNAAALDEVVATLEALARLAGAEIEVKRSYPPWQPDLESSLLATARATFERVAGRAPGLEVVHGGLECAVIGDKLPGMQMISIGPEILGLHAPGERLGISSTQRFYTLLGAFLDDLSR
ncbi:MAG: beta-Ala-His dipeptidase [Gaiellaceae bacterium]